MEVTANEVTIDLQKKQYTKEVHLCVIISKT